MTLGDGGTYFSLEATCAFAGGKSLVSFLKLKESTQLAITNDVMSGMWHKHRPLLALCLVGSHQSARCAQEPGGE